MNQFPPRLCTHTQTHNIYATSYTLKHTTYMPPPYTPPHTLKHTTSMPHTHTLKHTNYMSPTHTHRTYMPSPHTLRPQTTCRLYTHKHTTHMPPPNVHIYNTHAPTYLNIHMQICKRHAPPQNTYLNKI